MKIMSLNNITFAGENNKSKNHSFIYYPLVQITGAIAGYSIPLKDIDGPEQINDMGRNLSLRKTLIPNEIGKWKNALAGAFIGTAIAVFIDYLLKNKNIKK